MAFDLLVMPTCVLHISNPACRTVSSRVGHSRCSRLPLTDIIRGVGSTLAKPAPINYHNDKRAGLGWSLFSVGLSSSYRIVFEDDTGFSSTVSAMTIAKFATCQGTSNETRWRCERQHKG